MRDPRFVDAPIYQMNGSFSLTIIYILTMVCFLLSLITLVILLCNAHCRKHEKNTEVSSSVSNTTTDESDEESKEKRQKFYQLVYNENKPPEQNAPTAPSKSSVFDAATTNLYLNPPRPFTPTDSENDFTFDDSEFNYNNGDDVAAKNNTEFVYAKPQQNLPPPYSEVEPEPLNPDNGTSQANDNIYPQLDTM